MVGNMLCMARIVRVKTVPSPMPASSTRSAGGLGFTCFNSCAIRVVTCHFSMQVVTNIKYFSRLSKKRKGDLLGLAREVLGILVSFLATAIFRGIGFPLAIVVAEAE